jgi:hypothetical protein
MASRCASISRPLLPLLPCQYPEITYDLPPDPRSSFVSKDDTLIAPIHSLFCYSNSLFEQKKFPVPLRREFGSKPLNSLAD